MRFCLLKDLKKQSAGGKATNGYVCIDTWRYQLRGTFPVVRGEGILLNEMSQSRRVIEALSGKPRPGWGLRICALVSLRTAGPSGRLMKSHPGGLSLSVEVAQAREARFVLYEQRAPGAPPCGEIMQLS